MVLFKSLLSYILYTKGGIIIKKYLSLIILSFLLCAFSLQVNAFETRTVVLGGESIGLQINSKVSIVGFYDVETNNHKKISPWKDSDILEGDIIISVDDNKVESNANITKIIANKQKVKLKLLRNQEKYINTYIDVVTDKYGKKSIGLYVKDKILGVGTLTFIDPVTKGYGALGHSIANGQNEGQLLLSSIKSIRKASPGIPGEKYATLSNSLIGSITKNTDIGIFGKVNKIVDGQKIKIQGANKVRPGKAQILTVVRDRKSTRLNSSHVRI